MFWWGSCKDFGEIAEPHFLSSLSTHVIPDEVEHLGQPGMVSVGME